MNSTVVYLLLIPIILLFGIVFLGGLPKQARSYIHGAFWLAAIFYVAFNPYEIYPLIILLLISVSGLIRHLCQKEILKSRVWANFYL